MGCFPVILAQPPLASAPSGLAAANTLAFSVVIVALGLAILLAINYYRRRDTIEAIRRRRRAAEREGGDLISQLPYMSREELKEMILRERAARLAAEAEQHARTEAGAAEPADISSPVQEDLSKPQEEEKTVQSVTTGMPSQSQPHTQKTDSISIIQELALSEAMAAKDEPEPKKHPYSDKIERSALSTDLPEEFRRRSRRV